ncbi:MAG TPA: TipAS antibiotic-recognition domain-containing protein [Candidatus Limicola stercorigallinarum]|nr:TipAS antibiotic-recognition domain-containing protein [Candidatus Limicola stercorigallinarum]
MRGDAIMSDAEKFESLKRKTVEDNERRYGAEARERYGDRAVDESNRKMLGMSEEDFAAWQQLEIKIREMLEAAVRTAVDPGGPEGERVCDLHRRWLSYTWPSYSAEAHRALSEAYVADERFAAYYDRNVPGCAAWLRDAILFHA